MDEFSSLSTKSELNLLRETLVLNFHQQISQHELKVYSQNGEDGVILEVINIFHLNQRKYYVEIGTQSGVECNSRYKKFSIN